MTTWEHLGSAGRSALGTNDFRLMPDDAMASGPASIALTPVASGHGLITQYSWDHPQDGTQNGILLAASPDEDGRLSVSLLDSWHQKPGPMHLSGRTLPDGDGFEVAGTYFETWGWQIDLRIADEITMVMRNVVPAEAIPEDSPMTAGAYEVMVLRAR